MRRVLFLAAAAVLTAAPTVSRNELRGLERRFDESIQRFNIDDPLDLIGPSRGLYIENYGVVFSSEVALVTVPLETPFRPRPKPEDVERLRQKKLARLPEMKKLMRNMMITSAAALKTMPPKEQVVAGVTFFYQPWEHTTGLPAQLVMRATRQSLVDMEAGRLKGAAALQAIEEHTY
ncbi:MAG: hypothetical protein R2729_18780 [Bryobacteraceae bacterium]